MNSSEHGRICRYRLAQDVVYGRRPDSDIPVALSSSSRPFSLGDDLGKICDILSHHPKGISVAELKTCLGEEWDHREVLQGIQVLQSIKVVTEAGEAIPVERESRLQLVPPLGMRWSWFDCAAVCALLRPLAVVLRGRIGLLGAAVGMLVQWAALRKLTLSYPDGTGILVLIALTVLIIATHEVAHGVVLSAAGGRPRRTGLKVSYLIPTFFCDVSEGWRLGSKDRLAIALAGVTAQSLMGGAIALIGIVYGRASILEEFVLINLVTIAFNLVPFMKLDGYLALAAALDIDDLSRQASNEWKLWIRSYSLVNLGRKSLAVSPRRSLMRAYGALQLFAPISTFIIVSTILAFQPSGPYLIATGVFGVAIGVVCSVVVGRHSTGK